MSYRKEKMMSLTGVNCANMSTDKLQKMSEEVLKNGMHGLCFSPYEEGQEPGQQISEQQIRRRLEIIKPYTQWVRVFSCTDGNENIPKIAKELGLKTLVGAWLGDDTEINEKEIQGQESVMDLGLVVDNVKPKRNKRHPKDHHSSNGYQLGPDEKNIN